MFDTANVENGGVYGLDAHLDRFMDSMAKALTLTITLTLSDTYLTGKDRGTPVSG